MPHYPTKAQRSAYAQMAEVRRRCDRRDRFAELQQADRERILTDDERMEMTGMMASGQGRD